MVIWLSQSHKKSKNFKLFILEQKIKEKDKIVLNSSSLSWTVQPRNFLKGIDYVQ